MLEYEEIRSRLEILNKQLVSAKNRLTEKESKLHGSIERMELVQQYAIRLERRFSEILGDLARAEKSTENMDRKSATAKQTRGIEEWNTKQLWLTACKAQILSVFLTRLNNAIKCTRLQHFERIGEEFTCTDTCSRDNFVKKQRGNAVGQNDTWMAEKRPYITLSGGI